MVVIHIVRVHVIPGPVAPGGVRMRISMVVVRAVVREAVVVRVVVRKAVVVREETARGVRRLDPCLPHRHRAGLAALAVTGHGVFGCGHPRSHLRCLQLIPGDQLCLLALHGCVLRRACRALLFAPLLGVPPTSTELPDHVVVAVERSLQTRFLSSHARGVLRQVERALRVRLL
jgi:hypothetical protein